MPQAFASEGPKIQTQQPERALVPPKRGSFDHQHLQSVMAGGDHSGEAGGAGPTANAPHS